MPDKKSTEQIYSSLFAEQENQLAIITPMIETSREGESDVKIPLLLFKSGFWLSADFFFHRCCTRLSKPQISAAICDNNLTYAVSNYFDAAAASWCRFPCARHGHSRTFRGWPSTSRPLGTLLLARLRLNYHCAPGDPKHIFTLSFLIMTKWLQTPLLILIRPLKN